jgi:hypothetical protein
MTNEEIRSKLHSSKSPDRRRAAKEIGKSKLADFADDLYKAYLKERTDKRTWETQVAMILAIGMVNHKEVLKEIEPIIRANDPHDMITDAAAQTYVRLKRESINDAKPVLELLRFGGLSIVDGALSPLGYDKMLPDEKQIKQLINLSWNLHKHKDLVGFEDNYCDPRYGIAAACAGWDRELTKDFLRHCVATGDTPVIYVAENSLKGKYVRLR